jgi:hypothetical protein
MTCLLLADLSTGNTGASLEARAASIRNDEPNKKPGAEAGLFEFD